jgi:heme-degrading monooxygenase HmoA
MPIISADHLTVLNLFTTDTPDKQDHLIGAMRDVVDNAAYPGWISSTVHSGQDKLGTANFIQWRSGEDLEARYAGEEFKHRTLPLFREITTSIKLLQTEVSSSQRHPSLGEVTEIAPERGDYTVIELLGVAAENQDKLITTLSQGQTWLLDSPGYLSHTVLRGLRARGVDGAFVAVYSQWEDKEAYDAFVALSEADQLEQRIKTQARVNALVTWREWNTYRVVHARSAQLT